MKQVAWDVILPELQQGLRDGKGYELSVIRDHLNCINDQANFHNKDVKIFLINQFGSEIYFTYPSALNKSMMKIPDPILRFLGYLYNFNPESYQRAAETVMSEANLMSEDDDENDGDEGDDTDTDNNLSTQCCRKMHSIFQILYYIYTTVVEKGHLCT